MLCQTTSLYAVVLTVQGEFEAKCKEVEAKQNQVQGIEEELKGCEQQLRESKVRGSKKNVRKQANGGLKLVKRG